MVKKSRSLHPYVYLTSRNADKKFLPLVFEAPGTADSHCNRTDHQAEMRNTTSCSVHVSDCICLVYQQQEETVKNFYFSLLTRRKFHLMIFICRRFQTHISSPLSSSSLNTQYVISVKIKQRMLRSVGSWELLSSLSGFQGFFGMFLL